MKTCSVCKKEKEIKEFYNYKYTKDGKCYRCKDCDKKAQKEYRINNPEKSSYSIRNRNLKHKYGLSISDYDELFAKQNYSCAICETTKNKVAGVANSFSVDHCHTTGKIRGLLCNQCNRGLGMLLDSADILEKALKYLKQDGH